VTRGILVSIFTFSCASFLVAQQDQPPLPVFSTERTADLEHLDTPSLPDSPRQDLPDAPNRPPLQARRMTFGERFQLYRHSIANPDSLLSPAFGAAVGQASNEPPEWGQGASGYGTRLASGYGRMVINRTIRFGVAALDHEDPRFVPSNEKGFWRRFRQSSVNFAMPRTDGDTRIPAFSRFAGTYGAAFIANAWYPESRANAGHAMLRGSTSLAASYAWHVFREFWPDIKNAIHHPKERETDYRNVDP
jgi:hypothetical protein